MLLVSSKKLIDMVNSKTKSLTKHGVEIKANLVPLDVCNRKSTFKVCQLCGKCYWDGTHQERVLKGSLGKIVRSTRNQ